MRLQHHRNPNESVINETMSQDYKITTKTFGSQNITNNFHYIVEGAVITRDYLQEL